MGTIAFTKANTYLGNDHGNQRHPEHPERPVAGGDPTTGLATVVQTGATLELQGNINVSTEALTINGPGYNNQGALEGLSGNNIWSKTFALGSNSFIGSTGNTANDSFIINQDEISERRQWLLRAPRVEARVLSNTPGAAGAANTYTGLTQVNGGTLLLNKSPGVNAIAGNLQIGDGTSNPATGGLDSVRTRCLQHGQRHHPGAMGRWISTPRQRRSTP